MTGRELILYILENGLENEEVFNDGDFIGFMSIKEFAKRCGVGIETVRVWIYTGMIDAVQFNDKFYIPANATKPVIVGIF